MASQEKEPGLSTPEILAGYTFLCSPGTELDNDDREQEGQNEATPGAPERGRQYCWGASEFPEVLLRTSSAIKPAGSGKKQIKLFWEKKKTRVSCVKG